MRLNVTMVGQELFKDVHIVHQKVLIFRMRCLAHRLMCFGWEGYVNEYEPREQLMLAALLADRQHNAVVREAYKRGDPTLRTWIATTLPDVVSEAA